TKRNCEQPDGKPMRTTQTNQRVGCDWEVDSNAKEDRCGICHGDGSQCKTLHGSYNKQEGKGYKEAASIPAGARNIKVEEVGNSKNYIGIGSAASGKFFLNGNWQITLAGEYEVAGTPALYERDRDLEKVHMPGPIKEDVVIYLIFRGRYRNFGVTYEYTVPKKQPVRVPQYKWMFSDWSSCSATCEGGTQESHPVCQEKDDGTVSEDLCSSEEKPDHMMRVCNTHPCPARWWIGPWQLCPVTCGLHAMRKRTVICVELNSKGSDGKELALPDSECQGQERPSERELCPNLPSCMIHTTARPILLDLSTSSSLFTSALPQTVDSNEDSEEDDVNLSLSIDSDDSLQEDDLVTNSITTDRNKVSEFSDNRNGTGSGKRVNEGGWAVKQWKPCSVTCGSGVRTRSVVCLKQDGKCNLNNRPRVSEDCYVKQNCNLQFSSGWISTENYAVCQDKLLPTLCSSFKHLCTTSWYIKSKCCDTYLFYNIHYNPH
ncbi:hypothetical protein L9F63_020364, partial [Diploptera punctata]